MNSPSPNILLADHEPRLSEAVRAYLEAEGYGVTVVNSSEEALTQGAVLKPQLLVIDPMMPRMSGVEVATRLSRETNCKVLFLTPFSDDPDFRELVRGLLRQGCDAGILSKPFDWADLIGYTTKKIGPPQRSAEEGRIKQSIPSVQEPQQGAYENLLQIATIDLYQTNAFRITGLNVDASLREVSREVEKVEMMIKIGRTPSVGGLLPLPEPPSVESVKTALQSLKNPENRLLQELFWFWPCTSESKNDPALQAMRQGQYKTAVDCWTKTKGNGNGVAIHNLAIFHHLGALDSAVRRSKTSGATPVEEIYLWTSAYRYWKALLDRSDFWDALVSRIRAINDPRLRIETSQRIWATLPNAIVAINAQQSVDAAERGDFEEAAKHRKLVYASAFGESPAVEETRRALSHAQEELDRLCENAEKNGLSNPKGANVVARKLLDDKSKLLRTFNYLLGVGDPICDAAHDRVAEAARFCIVQYVNETDDWESTRAVLEECLALTEGKALRLKLEDELEIVRRNFNGRKQSQAHEEIERFCDNARREAKANPKLANLAARKLLDDKSTLQTAFSTLLGISTAMCDAAHDSVVAAARSCMVDYVNETEDWKTAQSFTQECLSLAKGEALRLKLKEDLEIIGRNLVGQQQSQSFHGEWKAAPVPTAKAGNKRKVALALVIGAVVLFAAVKGCEDTGLLDDPASSQGMTRAPSSEPKSQPSSGYTDYSSQRESSPFVGTEQSQSELKAEIDADRRRLDALENEVKAAGSNVEHYDSVLGEDKSSLDRMKRDNEVGIEVDEMLYETTRQRYNANVDTYNQWLSEYRTKVAQYKELLAATNAKIDRYNSQGRAR